MNKAIKSWCTFIAAICLFCSASAGLKRQSADAAESSHITETAIVKNNLAGAPTVVSRLDDAETLSSLSQTKIPANLIMTMNGDGNIVGKSGEIIGKFTELYKTYVEAVMIPVVEVNEEAAADKLIEIWNEEIGIIDMAAMSSSSSLLKKVRTALPKIRGVYDCSDKALADGPSWYQQIKNANLSMANVVVLSQEQATVESVKYFQYRLKTVWTELDADKTDTFAVQSVVSTGAYGIISSDFKTVYAAYDEYEKPSVARISANIAHRGLPYTMTENTIAGYKTAAEAGATHIDADAHLTKDNQVVIMHDATLDRTTNGTGAISSMTLDEIQKYKVTKSMNKVELGEEPIPTAEELFREFKGTDIVIVFEIKTGDTNICAALEEAIEKYDFWDQIIIISFNLPILKAVHEQLPAIPTASLAGFPRRNFEKNLPAYNQLNTVADAAIGDMGEADYYDSIMKDRGFMSFFWTYGVSQDCVQAMSKGIYGLTNNSADVFGEERVGGLYGKEGQQTAKSDLKRNAKITIVKQTYEGIEKEVTGTVFAVKDCGGYAEVIAYLTEAEDLLYTPAFRVNYKDETASDRQSDSPSATGCGSVAFEGALGKSLGILFLAASGIFVLLSKRKNY